VPVKRWPSSICVSTAIAILSGRLAEQMMSPENPPRAGGSPQHRAARAVAGLHADLAGDRN